MNKSAGKATLAGMMLLACVLGATDVGANICVYKRPTVRHVCGVVVDSQGVAVPGANVTVFKDGIAIQSARTGQAGEFNFGEIQAGRYELDVTTTGFRHLRIQVILATPTKSCKHSLRIQIALAGECEDVRVTKNPLPAK